METIVVYATEISNRLKYVLNWLFEERIKTRYKFVSKIDEVNNLPFIISYGCSFKNSLSIPNTGLLYETGIKQREPEIGMWQGVPTFFALDDDNFTIPFDLFSAIFYLLSRYEEYYPFKPDKYDRYPATESILYKQGLLLQPIVDEWVFAFKDEVEKQFHKTNSSMPYSFEPTYDIDMAYSYRYKGLRRTAGAYIRDIVAGNMKQISERTSVLVNTQDPFDSFCWIQELHKHIKERPKFFILAALRTTDFDKNIHPLHKAMAQLINRLALFGEIGMHPSYFSEMGEIMNREKNTIEAILGNKILISRQHYIKFRIPDTLRNLENQGITDDYSMGYGTNLGFRAGTGSSFLWYDIVNEIISTIRIHPFCFMDTTALYNEKLSVEEAFSILRTMNSRIKNSGSCLTTIFHNFSLGNSTEWVGWKKAYEDFVVKEAR